MYYRPVNWKVSCGNWLPGITKCQQDFNFSLIGPLQLWFTLTGPLFYFIPDNNALASLQCVNVSKGKHHMIIPWALGNITRQCPFYTLPWNKHKSILCVCKGGALLVNWLHFGNDTAFNIDNVILNGLRHYQRFRLYHYLLDSQFSST